MKFLLGSLLCASLCLAGIILASDRRDFSGTYTLMTSSDSKRIEKDAVHTLSVAQTETSIRITESISGKQTVSTYSLNGQEGAYISPGGAKGTCKGQFKRNHLVLESVVTTRPETNGPVIQIHTKQRWELSPDGRKLIIRFDVDSPQSAINAIEPWTDIYTRN
jgi:hypothetical protein